MRSLSASELLEIWEAGIDQPLLEKTLRLLAKACSADDYHEMARLSIGQRDARLLQLREWIFGSRVRNLATCPACLEKIEWETKVNDLRLQPVTRETGFKTFHLEKDEFLIRFRLPDSNDLSRTIVGQDYHKTILAGCILEIIKREKNCSPEDLPESVWELLNQRMGEEDPQADITINVQCPVCSHQWEARFDIVSFLWAEINSRIKHLLREIYHLARSFNWSEKDILNMSARRRQLYLQMLSV